MHKLLEKYNAAKAAAQALVDSAKADGREFTDAEQEAFDAHVAEATDLKAKMAKATKSAQDLANLGDIELPAVPEVKTFDQDATPRLSVKERASSPGDAFVKSAEYTGLLKSNPNGIPNGMPVNMGRVAVGELKTLLTDPGLTPVPQVFAPTSVPVTDLTSAVTIVPAASSSFKVLRATFTNAAAAVAEGAAKPESALSWASETITLETIAHHIPVTTQTLAHNAGIRAMIDSYLVNGVRAKVDTALGVTIAGTSGLGTQAFATDLRTTIRKALTKAQKAGAVIGAVPTGILISADDAETLDLEQIANLSLAPGQAPSNVGGIWRLPLVISYSLPAGFAYVGDLSLIQLHTFGGVNVMTGWINDQFTKNELTILAETEAKGFVMVPGAIIKADLTV